MKEKHLAVELKKKKENKNLLPNLITAHIFPKQIMELLPPNLDCDG